MLVYCDRCGRIFGNTFEEPNKICDCCRNLMKVVPRTYHKNQFFAMPNEMKRIHEELILQSPNFDEKLFKKMNEKMELWRQELRVTPSKPTNVPKCPTCQSTNIRKIGGVERGASILTFGIFSKKINKTFKCGNCSHTW